jgi:hypothetical protein
MPDEPIVYGLYESFAASATVDLRSVAIYHHQFVARDDAHAMTLAREKSNGIIDVKVTRLMDVRPMS